MKLFVYPQHKEKQILNPYLCNMEKYFSNVFDIVHKEYRIHLPQPMRLLLQSGKADVYILNWIEMSDNRKIEWLRGILAMLSLFLIKLRKRKIVWFFHDMHPHNGESFWSLKIRKWLFDNSTMIVTHSKEAEDYSKQYAKCPVYFRNHPIAPRHFKEWESDLPDCDFYVWGKIVPYKGIAELVSNPICEKSKMKFLIVGSCSDEILKKNIECHVSDNVIFENRTASFDEIAAQCKKAKYVLFPYLGDSISSSGVLMDTIQMGGTPVGPNRGAFADMEKEGCCITYNDISEIFYMPTKEGEQKRLRKSSVDKFLEENSWDAFGRWFYELIDK